MRDLLYAIIAVLCLLAGQTTAYADAMPLNGKCTFQHRVIEFTGERSPAPAPFTGVAGTTVVTLDRVDVFALLRRAMELGDAPSRTAMDAMREYEARVGALSLLVEVPTKEDPDGGLKWRLKMGNPVVKGIFEEYAWPWVCTLTPALPK